MQALSLSANQENVNPNQGLIPQDTSSWTGYGNQYIQLSPEQFPGDIAPLQKMFGVTDNNNNTMMQQLLQQMQTMQQQISGINITNQQQNQFEGKYNTTNKGSNNNGVNPKIGLP